MPTNAKSYGEVKMKGKQKKLPAALKKKIMMAKKKKKMKSA